MLQTSQRLAKIHSISASKSTKDEKVQSWKQSLCYLVYTVHSENFQCQFYGQITSPDNEGLSSEWISVLELSLDRNSSELL